MVRVDPQAYRALDLEVHAFLADVPLHDVSRVELPGGGPDRTINDVRRLMGAAAGDGNVAVRALFNVRKALGQLFGWDRDKHARASEAYLTRIPDALRQQSTVEPGTAEGPFKIVYVLPREMLTEIRNATVHAFSCTALEPTESGYLLYWAIYVRPVSWMTRPYMLAIEPFRRWVVYPTLLRKLQAGWRRAYSAENR